MIELEKFVRQRVKYGAIGVAALFLLMTAWGSVYSIPQNSVGAVTRFGALKGGIVEPGPHLKMPWVDSVYVIPTSLDRIEIPQVTTTTVDNQFVYLKQMSVTAHVSKEHALQALFGVGRMGDVDIVSNAIPIIMDRTLRVFGKVNTLSVNQQKEELEKEIMAEASPDVLNMFGIVVDAVQFPNIDYDERFKNSIGATNEAKLRIVQAQAETAQAEGQAKKAEAVAHGAAEAQIEKARGDAESQKLTADATAHATQVSGSAEAAVIEAKATAQADAIKLAGMAEAATLQAKVNAVGGSSAYVQTLYADALSKWNGSVPQFNMGGDKQPLSYLPLPVPSLLQQSR